MISEHFTGFDLHGSEKERKCLCRFPDALNIELNGHKAFFENILKSFTRRQQLWESGIRSLFSLFVSNSKISMN